MFGKIQHRRIYRRKGYIHAFVVLAAASSVCVARDTFPVFSGAHAVSATAGVHHDQRPRFDNRTVDSYTATSSFLLSAPAESEAEPVAAAAAPVSFHIDAPRYNRPPPIL